MRYAGFWSRLVAGAIDTLVLLPVTVLFFWAFASSKTAALLLMVPLSAVNPAYHIVLHARRGQTIGKMATQIRVTRLSGDPIAWREAWLRSSVDIALALVGTIAYGVAVADFPDLAWNLGWLEKSKRLIEYQPAWGTWTGYVAQAWFWSEIVVLLFNRQKRALHDFIAGTVVVHAR